PFWNGFQNAPSSRPLLLLLVRLGLAHLDGAHDELGVQPFGAILDATEKSVRRAALVAAIERALALALLFGLDVVAYEDFAADRYALGMRLAPARIERMLVGVHFTSPLCVKK